MCDTAPEVGPEPTINTNTKRNLVRPMKTKAIFYHAGCPVCLAAETFVTTSLDRAQHDLEIVHLGSAPGRRAEAEHAGVRSVPALVIAGATYHINHGADLAAL